MDSFDIFVESAARRMRCLEGWLEAARHAKRIITGLYPNARVLVFGSVVRGEATAMSDLDLLVIVDKRETKREAEARASVWRELPDCPIQLHFATERELRDWYMRFIDKLVEV